MNKNIVKPLANAICIACYEPCEDNQLVTQNETISYGTIIIMDMEYMYIKMHDTSRTKELLYDVSMPITAYHKCRYEIQKELEACLLAGGDST